MPLIKSVRPVLAPALEKVISIYISVPIAIDSPTPVTRNIDAVAPPIPSSDSRAPGPATVPTTIARIVTINELAELFILAAPSTTTLRGSHHRQGRQQKQTQQNQDHLAIAFHQLHKRLQPSQIVFTYLAVR
jgi:hypothetical protein